MPQPHLAFREQLRVLHVKLEDDTTRRFPLSAGTVEALTDGMRGVVNEGGTGAGGFEPGLDMGGKTGTAQVVSSSLKQSSKNVAYRNNAWFVGYAPSRDPRIVVCALILHGEHSALAVPMVRDVIKAYLAKYQIRRKNDQMQTQIRVMSLLHRGQSEGPGKSAW